MNDLILYIDSNSSSTIGVFISQFDFSKTTVVRRNTTLSHIWVKSVYKLRNNGGGVEGGGISNKYMITGARGCLKRPQRWLSNIFIAPYSSGNISLYIAHKKYFLANLGCDESHYLPADMRMNICPLTVDQYLPCSNRRTPITRTMAAIICQA